MLKKISKNNIFRYLVIAGLSFLVDLLFFSVFIKIIFGRNDTKSLLLASVVSRVISSLLNYLLNRNFIFVMNRKSKIDSNSLFRYYALVVVQALLSFLSINVMTKITNFEIVYIKIFVDVILFVMNYFLQKKFVFNAKKNILFSLWCFVKSNYLFAMLVVSSLLLQTISLNRLGVSYNLNSDDLSYVNSGIQLIETGKITMHGMRSAQIMPLMPIFIGFVYSVFGQNHLWLALKIVWIVFSMVSLIYIYLIGLKLTENRRMALVPVLFSLTPDFIWMNNLILTETPYIMCLSGLVYYSIKISDRDNTNYNFLAIIIFFILSMMLKANIALYPLLLIIILYFKKYNPKKLARQLIVGSGIVVAILLPWTIRNMIVFHTFIPLTYGAGNPLLLGTYQGEKPPNDDARTEEYVKGAIKNLQEQETNDEIKSLLSLKKDEIKAKYRIKKWVNENPISFFKSYLYIKPKILFSDLFYWKEIFGTERSVIYRIRIIQFFLFIITSFTGTAYALIKRTFDSNVVLLYLILISQIAVYSSTFAFGRYGQSLLFIIYLIIIYNLTKTIKFMKLLLSSNNIVNN